MRAGSFNADEFFREIAVKKAREDLARLDKELDAALEVARQNPTDMAKIEILKKVAGTCIFFDHKGYLLGDTGNFLRLKAKDIRKEFGFPEEKR
ncbi:MAG: hypothetical protein AAB933_01105 [Patescibacteria group bacterium]